MSDGLPDSFDVESYRVASSLTGGNRWRCSTPDPTKYHDPTTQSLEGQGGRTLLQATGARFGIKGVVIPRATFGGASLGIAHNKPGVVVIDPGEDGKGLQVDLSKIQADRAARALTLVNRVVAAQEGMTDIEKVRCKSAAFYHVVAQEEVPVARPEPVAVAAVQSPPLQQPVPVQSPVNLSAAFDETPVMKTGQPAHIADSSSINQQKTVTFGIGGEDVPASYSTVIRQPGARPGTGMLVLGSIGPAFYPKGTRPFAAYLAGDKVVLQLEATGIRFAHAGEELAVYMITGERPI
jgi:hypothetical protein